MKNFKLAANEVKFTFENFYLIFLNYIICLLLLQEELPKK